MKIILKEDVSALGKEGEVVSVKDGYANNFLIPRGLAVRDTLVSRKVLAERESQLKRHFKRLEKDASALAEALNDKEIEIEARSGRDGKLYGSVTTTEIADKITAKFKIKIDKRKLRLEDPIKRQGRYPVAISFSADHSATVYVKVFDPEHLTEDMEQEAKS